MRNLSSDLAQDEAQSAADLMAQEEGAETTLLNQSLGASADAVDVYLLTCTGNFAGQKARAAVLDIGGFDGRRFYVQLTRTATGQTSKRTAPDGALSLLAAVIGGGAGSTHFVFVGKDRPGAEPYNLGAGCVVGGGLTPHTLVRLQNQ